MDKRTVISAYYRGELSLQECAQILGLELSPLQSWLQQDKTWNSIAHESHELQLDTNSGADAWTGASDQVASSFGFLFKKV
ncbi:hypothetical protein MH117_03420 [Paenibacillus sp. ACRRX]|uniref:hypothetical protein n=1 Tax=Paenibacillus sp. ACRRX TaxID=2918206 RepID=UPI001EF59512|nr:hypothetical protein [Paenibacillus sp. ACRRX]MCG7406454.1 hypothetical protein [Paenibacillus sp. ACRRX]